MRATRRSIVPVLRRGAYVAPSSFVGALDSSPAAGAAYGVRRLRAGYTGALIRVRRSNDNAEQDIGVTVGGDLDTTALTAFVGANSAYVTTWYDQSGNSRHATQTTTANQPRIVNAGAVETLRGKPCIYFLGDDWLSMPSAALGGTAGSLVAVVQNDDDPPGSAGIAGTPFWPGNASYPGHYPGTDGIVYAAYGASTMQTGVNPALPLTDAHVMATLSANNNLRQYYNNNQLFQKTSNTVAWESTPQIGRAPSNNWNGRIAELTTWQVLLADVEFENYCVNQMYYFNLGMGFLASGLRKKANRPFSVASHYNQPIKASAQRVASGIVYTSESGSESGYPTRFTADAAVIVMRPVDPDLTVNYSNVGWDAGDRCNTTGAFGGFPQTVKCPTAYTLPDSDENNVGTFLLASNVLAHNNAFTRCVASNPATAFRVWPNTTITGDSIEGAHGGSGISGAVAIRGGEFTDGLIRHVGGINLHAAKYYKNNGAGASHVEPATTEDNYWSSYGGTNAYLMPGSLLVLPANFNLGALRTKAGRVIARMFMFHGVLCIDDSHWNNWALATAQGPDENVTSEFATVHGFAFAQTSHGVGSESNFMLDMIDIMQATQIVINNTAAGGWGGGSGTSLVPVVSAIGD